MTIEHTLHTLAGALAGEEAAGIGLRAVDGAAPGTFYALRPAGTHLEIVDLEKHLPHPTAKRGEYELTVPADFAGYVNRHATARTEVWAQPANGKVTAVIDGHAEAEPGWGRHTATLELERSTAFRALVGIVNLTLSQADLAVWVDEMAEHITDPHPGVLAELIDNLQITSSGKAAQVRRSGGGTHLTWDEETRIHAGAAGVELPSKLTLEVPVFDGVPAAARLEVRLIVNAKIGDPFTFKLQCPRIVDAVTTHGRMAVDIVRESLSPTVPVFEGRPQ